MSRGNLIMPIPIEKCLRTRFGQKADAILCPEFSIIPISFHKRSFIFDIDYK